MRSLILSLFFVALSSSVFAQVETCADSQMPVNVTALTPSPSVATTLTIDPTYITNAEGYTPSALGAGFTTIYWSFTVDAMQFYTISIEGAPGSPAIGNDISISLSDDCTDLNSGSEEIFAGPTPNNLMAEDATCTNLAPGVTYTLAIAIDPSAAGDIIVNVLDATGATNLSCATAAPLPVGMSVGNNSCSSGLVWYSYTVVNGGSVSVAVSPTGPPTGITSPVITQSILDLCGNTAEPTNSWTCLPVGTIIYFEAGDNMAPIEEGDFNINITDNPTGIANETCALAAAMPVAAPSCMPTVLTTTNNTTVGACPDNTFSGCPVFNTENTVWYAFTTDADAQTVNITVTGDTEYALLNGTACPTSVTPGVAIGGCQTAGTLTGATVLPSTTYFIAVATSTGGTDGPFTVTVTPQNPPANDICTSGAQDISGTAAAGVNGTTACATNDPLNFCPAIAEDHVVYYTYTVDAGITTNRTVTITTTSSTIPSGTAATSLGYGIFTDCAGTAYMNTPTSGMICSPLTAPIVYECVEPGTVLTIAVASADMMEGDFNIMITEMATGTATNDICNIATNPDITTVTTGTNFCADGELTFCGMSTTADHQVWYMYTNNTGSNVDLGLTFTGTGTGASATDLSMFVLIGDCTNTVFPGTAADSYCNILDAGQQIISCIEDGEIVSILLGSAEDPTVPGPEGNFNIASNVISNSPVNDECTGATDITASLVNCTYVPITVNNENACPEDFTSAGCTFNEDATVWYSFTVPNNGLVHTLEIQNINAGSYLGIWDAAGIDCDAPGTFAISSDCESGVGPHGAPYDDLTNGNTYIIAVANPAEATNHSFEIKLNELPANDECMDAVVLASTVPTAGTTTCATAEMPPFDSGVCADTDEENTVWYEITVPAGSKGFNITVSSSATGPISGSVNAVLFETTTAGCVADASTFVEEDCLTLGMLSQTFECVGAGTYLIRISSSDANSGNFDIVFESLTLGQPNDECDLADAITLNPGLECEWMEDAALTTGACPEDPGLDPDTDCAIDEFPVVWYSVTSPAGAEFLDLQINASPANRPFLAVFEDGTDCATLTATDATDCFTGVYDDLNALGEDLIDIVPNTTYLIAVGSEDASGSTINFGIKWIVPPANDECIDAVVLAGGAPTDGTTACATQPAGGEYNSAVCTDVDETNTVWYEYTVPATDKGFNVTITAAGTAPLMGDINLVVFESTAAGCDASAATLVDEVCTAAGTVNEEFECVGPGTYVIRVSTSAANEGSFQITIAPLALVQSNDNCDAADAGTLNPGLDCEWMPAMAATSGACPEDMNLESGGCMIDMFPTVWYEVTAPANAEFLDLRIVAGGTNPFIAVFDDGVDCDALVNTDGSTCIVGPFTDLMASGNTLIDVTPGNTYLIAVGSQNMNGTVINFQIKWITPPDNDECVDAELFDALAPTGTPGEFSQTYTMETTACATQDPILSGTGCDPDFTNTVWYTYTVEADVKEITIDVTNYSTIEGGATADFAVAVFMGCPTPFNLFNQADGTPAEYCGGEGVDLLRFSCLDEGDVLAIMVTSSSDDEGTFDITLNTAQPDCVYSNDECPDAILFSDPVIMDDPADCIPIPGCNDLACTEFDFSTVCPGLDVFNSVFFTFTTDDLLDGMGNPVDAFVNIEVTNGQSGELDSPGAILLSGDCASPAVIGACAGTGGVGEFNSGPLGMPGQILPNTTYTVVVYNGDSDQNGGTFDLCITVSSGCVNDEACDAFTLEPGVTVDNPASSVGCTPDVNVSGCGAAQNEATLWYQIEIPEGAESIEITLANQTAPDGVTGDVSIAVGQLVDCNNVSDDPEDVEYTECAGFGTHVIDCIVEYGIYYIQIGSEDEMEAGDFTITYTFNTAPTPSNDLCSDAQDLDVTEYCAFQNFNGTLEDACPELNDNVPCRFSDNPSVWYKITIPDPEPTVTTMDIRIDGMPNPNFGVYEFDCAAVSDPNMGILSTPVNADGPVGCVQMALVEGIEVTPGNEYYILVSSADMYEGDFQINIKLNAPPENDNPCITDINPPTDLTGSGSDMGSTCCATLDFANVGCSAATEDASVWYTFTPDDADGGYDIVVNGLGGANGAEGPMAVEMYTGPADGGCSGALTLVDQSCVATMVEFKIGNCFRPGDILFIKVTTDDPDENCGDFEISITPGSCAGEFSDDCIDTQDATPIMPVTPPDFAINYFCVPGCLDYACPEDDALGGCGQFTQAPTVWFQVDADENAAQMFTTVEANGNWDPVWSVYSGTSCDDLAIINFGGTPACSDGDGTPELHQVGVEGDMSYWIAVTLDPASLPSTGLDDGTFEICVATAVNAVICLGEDIGDCNDPSLVMEITDREVEDQPLEGPFCQGEEVTINISFFYDASETGQDWLIGMVPIFGSGWDLEAFDYDANAPTGNGQTAVWFEEGGDLAPIIQEDVPILCTFVNADGNLTLCNSLCDPCSDCAEIGMSEGDPLPGGYFWVSNGGNGGCDNDGSPGEGWGIGSTQAQIDWTFTLTTKEFDDPQDCIDMKDLSISFQTFSDGVGGCWEDPVGECILDRAMFSPPWELECEAPPAVEGPDQEICHDGITDIQVSTVDGTIKTIEVEVEDNPNVTGENNYTFPGGSGTIADDLTNISTDVQIVIYNVYSVDPTLPCPGVINQIEVTIYPELMVTFPPLSICEGFCTDIIPNVIGGQGDPYAYLWSTGATTPTINVCPTVPTTYFVTVTDQLGCEDIEDVEVIVRPALEDVVLPEIFVCKDQDFNPGNPDYIVCVDPIPAVLGGSPGYVFNWMAPSGLFGVPQGNCFVINEVTSTALDMSPGLMLGQYLLTAEVIDMFGCIGSVEVQVNITGELIVVLDPGDVDCGDTETTLTVTGLDNAGNPVPEFRLYGGCPMNGDLGLLIDDALSPSGVVTFQALDLEAFNCYCVVAVTASGCQTTECITIPITQGNPIILSGDVAVCEGESATITIDNFADYTSATWTPNIGAVDGSGAVTFIPDSTATYTVNTVEANGCVAQEVWTIDMNPLPSVDITGSAEFCLGSSTTVTATGGVSYTWSNGGVTGPTYTSSTDEETVTVTATDANGCMETATITFSEEPSITINLGNQDICDGMGDTVFVNSTYTDISWINTVDASEVSDTFFYIVTEAGSFEVSAIDPVGGCNAFGSFVVNDSATPMVSVPDTVNVCRLDSGIDSLCVDFTAQAVGSAGTWTQIGNIPGFTFSSFPLDEVCFEGIQTGCYAFSYRSNTAVAPCTNVRDTMIVCVNPCPCPNPGTSAPPNICNVSTYNLGNNIVTTDAGTWSVTSGPVAQDITGILSGNIFNANGVLPGDYDLLFTLNNPGGPACLPSSTQTITVEEQAMINPTGANNLLCNIAGQPNPTSLDLYDLISVDATDGGTWVQLGTGTTVTLTGPNGSIVNASDVATLPETLTFEYTSGATGSVCPPDEIVVTVTILDCNCPIIIVGTEQLCNDGLPFDLTNILTNPDGLTGTWSAPLLPAAITGDLFDPAGVASGAYAVIFTLDNDPGNNCPIMYTGEIIIRRAARAVPRLGDEPCSMDTGNGPTEINLYTWLVSGYTQGMWTQVGGDPLTITDNGVDVATVDFDGQDIGEVFMFEFTTTGANAPCVNITVPVTITVRDCDCPPIMITLADPLCNDDGMIDLCALVAGSDPGTFVVTSAGGTAYPQRLDPTGCIFSAGPIGAGNPLVAGTYTITYTLDQTVTGTCTQSVNTTLEISNYLSTTIMDPAEVCSDPNGSGIMTINFNDQVGNAGAGTWSDDDGSNVDISTIPALQSVSFVNVPAGQYNFTYTIDNADPCDNWVGTMTVTVVDDCNCPPISPDDPADVCSTDGPVDLTVYDDPDMSGTWSSDVLTVNGGNSLVIDGVTAGTYDLTYTVDVPTPDCPDSSVVMITIGEPASAGAQADAFRLCEGEAMVIDLDGELTGADSGGTWTETSGAPSTGFSGSTFDTDGQAAGTYTFEYAITATDPCPPVEATVTVIIDPNPTADPGGEKFLDCDNTSADLGGPGTTTGDGITYTWTLAGAQVGTTASINVANEGSYQLLVTNTNTGCVDSATVVVNVSDALPTLTFDANDITCNGDNDGSLTNVIAAGGDGNYTYSLNSGAFVTDAGSFTGLAPGDYTIEVMDGVGCVTPYTFTVVEPDPVSVEIAGEAILPGEPGDEFVLTIDPVGANIDSVVWSDFNDPTIIYCSGTPADCSTITVVPTENTTSVYVEVFDANGCSANDQVQIQLNQIVDVVFPNIISPNGDGTNDWFFIESKDVLLVLNMQIFDRWGELLFESKNFEPRVANLGWDGTFNGKPVVPGVYVFTVEVLFNDAGNTRELFSGDVTVTDAE